MTRSSFRASAILVAAPNVTPLGASRCVSVVRVRPGELGCRPTDTMAAGGGLSGAQWLLVECQHAGDADAVLIQ